MSVISAINMSCFLNTAFRYYRDPIYPRLILISSPLIVFETFKTPKVLQVSETFTANATEFPRSFQTICEFPGLRDTPDDSRNDST